MDLKKAKTAVIALTVATAIALSGTFAWQSISQMALNEATEATNPGGRLHDDFSGYGPEDTKDIYVENFGNEPIYARVRLDEYMELGDGAGLKGTPGSPNPANHAVSLVPGAKIDDLDTWTTHIPGHTAAETGEGTETGFADPSRTFHFYWTWTMGGQDTEGNPDGKTVYMPTFNKNKDSLKADINGTLAGTGTGTPYDDYVPYTAGTDTATRVRDTDTATYPDGAAYDADGDTTDECGPYGGAGGTGVDGTNYVMVEEEHKAQETMNASVITMAEYKVKTDEEKAGFLGWVYDVDGWAYWSQPIAPGTPTDTDKFITNATGVLLDRIVLENKPSEAWYYGINAVGQFITADDLGQADTPKTGFFADDARKPTDDALDLLEGIGVNTADVRGSVTPSATVTVGGDVKYLDYAVQGMNIDLSAVVTVAGNASPDQSVTWTLSGNTDANTRIDTTGATPVLRVSNSEAGNLKLTAESNTYVRLKGTIYLPVEPRAYIVTVTPVGGVTSALPGGSQIFSAVLSSNDFQTGLPQTFTWELETRTGAGYATDTAITANAADSSKATLTVAGNETGTVKVRATPTDTATYPNLSGIASIPVTPVTYTAVIKDTGGNAVPTATPVEIFTKSTADFIVDATSTPPGAHPTTRWTWMSSDPSVAAVTGSGANATVTVPENAPDGATATITAINGDDGSLRATFTVKAKERTPADVNVGETVKLDGVEYIVLLKDVYVNGKADGETTATSHKAALLLRKDLYVPYGTEEGIDFGPTNKWDASTIRTALNGTYLTTYPTAASKALEVTLYTRGGYNDNTVANRLTTDDKVFLLSEADVFGTSNKGKDTSPQAWEYTFNSARIPYFTDVSKRTAPRPWWLRSPASDYDLVAIVSKEGKVISYGCGDLDYFIRPAFWYNMDP